MIMVNKWVECCRYDIKYRRLFVMCKCEKCDKFIYERKGRVDGRYKLCKNCFNFGRR